MNKVNRTRARSLAIRMSESEYSRFHERLLASGLSKQTYVIKAVLGATITPSDEIAALKEISMTFADLERQLRGLATNVNQMAHVANGQGMLPTETELSRLAAQLQNYRRESEDVWQSIRSSINRQKATAP